MPRVPTHGFTPYDLMPQALRLKLEWRAENLDKLILAAECGEESISKEGREEIMRAVKFLRGLADAIEEGDLITYRGDHIT